MQHHRPRARSLRVRPASVAVLQAFDNVLGGEKNLRIVQSNRPDLTLTGQAFADLDRRYSVGWIPASAAPRRFPARNCKTCDAASAARRWHRRHPSVTAPLRRCASATRATVWAAAESQAGRVAQLAIDAGGAGSLSPRLGGWCAAHRRDASWSAIRRHLISVAGRKSYRAMRTPLADAACLGRELHRRRWYIFRYLVFWIRDAGENAFRSRGTC